jgi:hypothetical protein
MRVAVRINDAFDERAYAKLGLIQAVQELVQFNTVTVGVGGQERLDLLVRQLDATRSGSGEELGSTDTTITVRVGGAVEVHSRLAIRTVGNGGVRRKEQQSWRER